MDLSSIIHLVRHEIEHSCKCQLRFDQTRFKRLILLSFQVHTVSNALAFPPLNKSSKTTKIGLESITSPRRMIQRILLTRFLPSYLGELLSLAKGMPKMLNNADPSVYVFVHRVPTIAPPADSNAKSASPVRSAANRCNAVSIRP